MRLIRELYRPDLAMLPIGGHFTMDPPARRWPSSSSASHDVVPLHYGTFPILTGTPTSCASALAARGLGDVRVHAPEPGGRVGPG